MLACTILPDIQRAMSEPRTLVCSTLAPLPQTFTSVTVKDPFTGTEEKVLGMGQKLTVTAQGGSW